MEVDLLASLRAGPSSFTGDDEEAMWPLTLHTFETAPISRLVLALKGLAAKSEETAKEGSR